MKEGRNEETKGGRNDSRKEGGRKVEWKQGKKEAMNSQGVPGSP